MIVVLVVVYSGGFSQKSEGQQVFSGLQDICDFNSAVAWMAPIHPRISCSPRLFFTFLYIVPSTPSSVGITVIFTFSFFLRSKFIFMVFFFLICWNGLILLTSIYSIKVVVLQSHKKRMQQIGTEGVQGHTRLGGEGDPLGNILEI